MAKKSTRKSSKSNDKVIKVGVLGVGRGQSFASGAGEAVGMKLVALCDTWEERLNQVGEKYGVATYTDFDKFLEHDMDAVVLANYFHEHAPFAIKAMKAGKHVMSETTAAKTMAECVELCRTVEKTGQTYMFAENYPFSLGCQEMRRLYQAGEIGNVRYAEGEYNHPGEEDWRLSISPGENHWRNWLPPTYYCSHALAPLMCATDTMPKRVISLSIIEENAQSPATAKVSDNGAVILIRMDNGAVFRIWGLMMQSEHRVRYEMHGETGLISSSFGDVRVHHEAFHRKANQRRNETYTPEWPEHGDLAKKAGHGGGDFWTNFHFANAIREGGQPYLNVYRGAAMSAVGILAWRSCLEEGVSMELPDFTSEKERKPFAKDHWSPFPADAGPGQPAPSLRGYVAPGKKAMARAKRVWKRIGFKGE